MAIALQEALAPILVIEDSDDDVFLVQKAMLRARVDNPVVRAEDGMAAIEYLKNLAEDQTREGAPFPCFILLDIKMPRLNGIAFLSWLQKNPEFRRIPTVVFSSSQREEDVKAAYDGGAHSFISKPVDYTELVKLARASRTYWTRVRRTLG